MTLEHIRVEETAPVARVWLARAERRNAFDTSMLRQYVSTLEELAARSEVRAVIVAADGAHFCAGWDIAEFTSLGGDGADPQAALLESYALLERAWSVPVVTIGAVRGTVAGFGVGLLHRLHLAVGSSTTRIILPEIGFGIAAASVLVDLQRALPRKNALDLLLTGEPVSATRAAELGLLSRLVADADLENATQAIAQRIAAMPGEAPATVLRSFRLAQASDEAAAVREAARGAAATIRALGRSAASGTRAP
jgi:enoyl-CoA hydratase/carnithine racemase